MGLKTKDAQQRLDEVFAHVAGQVPAAERNAVTLYLTDWINGSTAGNHAAMTLVSDSMTMSDAANAGNKVERMQRRALILLELMKGANNPSTRVKGMAGGAVTTRVAELVEDVRVGASQTHGDGQLLRTAHGELLAHPQRFMRSHRVMMKNLRGGTHAAFFYDFATNAYVFDVTAPPAARNAFGCAAAIVPAVFWHQVPGRTNAQKAGSFAQITPAELTGANVMVSTQFSGCSFCFKVTGARIFAAHIMPDDMAGGVLQGGGAELARQLAGQVAGVGAGDFVAPGNGAGQFQVYGAGYSNLPAFPNGYPVRTVADQYMNILGVMKGGAWRIYSQHTLNGVFTTVRIY